MNINDKRTCLRVYRQSKRIRETVVYINLSFLSNVVNNDAAVEPRRYHLKLLKLRNNKVYPF